MRKLFVLLLLLGLLLASYAQSSRTQYFTGTDLTKYSDNMGITCVVKLNGVTVADCELAAFDSNGELRGSALSDPSDGGIIYLTIQGEGRTEVLHFKVVTGTSTVNTINETYTFAANAMVGTYDSPYEFTFDSSVGDVNNNGLTNIGDVAALIHLLLNPSSSVPGDPDVDASGQTTISDVTALRNLILGK